MIDLELCARRHGVAPSGVGCLALAVGMRHWAQVSVDLPLGVRSTPLWICLPALMAMMSLPVASTPHTELERQSARLTPTFRLVVGLASTALAMTGAVVMADRPIAVPIAAWTLALCAAGLVAVTVVGTGAWAPVALLGLGLTSVAAGGTGPDLVSSSAGAPAVTAAAGCWVAALVTFSLVEPGRAARRLHRPSHTHHEPEEPRWQPR